MRSSTARTQFSRQDRWWCQKPLSDIAKDYSGPVNRFGRRYLLDRAISYSIPRLHVLVSPVSCT